VGIITGEGMEQNHRLKSEPEPLLAVWIKWTMDFWESLAQMGPRLAEAEAPGASRGGRAAPLEDSGSSALKMWEAFFSLLSEPRTVDAVFKGIKPPAEIILKTAQMGWGGYAQLHQRWLEGLGQEETEALTFENLDQDTFKAWADIYEEDLKQLLHHPPLGLTRFSQEKASRVVVEFGRLQAAMAEFMYLLYLPMRKSLRVMQERLRRLAGEGELSEDFKDYYKMWLKLLEGHYMTLFKSPQYTRTLSHTLEALEDFTQARQELLADALKALPLPTLEDLDELYHEIYLLKKQVKALSKRLAKLEAAP
jgi:class III poly(R)-hydroxyalkanoic acid synthase PhaE subunit